MLDDAYAWYTLPVFTGRLDGREQGRHFWTPAVNTGHRDRQAQLLLTS